jgi:hypothetical protein
MTERKMLTVEGGDDSDGDEEAIFLPKYQKWCLNFCLGLLSAIYVGFQAHLIVRQMVGSVVV